MPIPDLQSIMRPLIDAHSDGKQHLNRDLVRQLADQFVATLGAVSLSRTDQWDPQSVHALSPRQYQRCRP
jgi:hypothetical protein